MRKYIRISIFEVVGSSLCVAYSGGQQVYYQLAAALTGGRDVLLSLRKVTALTAAFLNAATGQLYRNFNEKHIQNLLKVENVEQNDLAFLKSVVGNAKLYFKDPQRFNQAVREVMGDDDITTIVEVSL